MSSNTLNHSSVHNMPSATKNSTPTETEIIEEFRKLGTLLVFLQKLDYLGTMSGDLEEFEPNEIANDAEDVAETRREIIRNGWTIPTAEDYDTLHGWLCALQWSFPELFAAYKGPGICSYYEFQNADAIEARYEKARLDDAKKL